MSVTRIRCDKKSEIIRISLRIFVSLQKTKKNTNMSKVNEPMPIYYSQPQITALKKRLKASIERENNVEVLLQYESLICSQLGQKYDEAYFAKIEKDFEYLKGAPMPCCYSEDELDDVIKESEKSGIVDDNEIKAFFARWENML